MCAVVLSGAEVCVAGEGNARESSLSTLSMSSLLLSSLSGSLITTVLLTAAGGMRVSI
jgi:hypothetical protein